jgi:ABC-type multidrug transport system fused ATPase/permease subunit
MMCGLGVDAEAADGSVCPVQPSTWITQVTTLSAASASADPKHAQKPGSPVPPRDPVLDMLGLASITNQDLFRWMFRFLRPVTGYVFLACLWLSASVAVEVITTLATGAAVDDINALHPIGMMPAGLTGWLRSADPAVSRLRWVIVLLSVLIVIMVIVRYLREVANAKMSMNMVYYIREAVYDKLQRVGFAFHDAISTGQLINRALSDLQNVRAFVQTAIISTLDIGLTVVFYIVMIWLRVNHWMALLSLAPLPIWTYYIYKFSERVQPVGKSVMESQDKNVSIIAETIAGVHVIKAFATEQQEITKYRGSCDQFLTRTLQRIRLFADFQPVIRSIATASHLSLFLVGGILLLRGQLQPGHLLILSAAMAAILARLQQVATINEQYQNAIVSSRRLYEVLMALPSVSENPAAKALPPGRGELVFENVSFGYDPAKPVLHDINLRIAAGSIVALVGPTGCGKTTFVNLIARFYDPQQGRILLDGMDLRDATLNSLREQVAFVFQETYLFSDTVAANIAYGRPHVLDAAGRPLPGRGEIEMAARLAQAHEFIEALPKGYDTVLAERGSSLSGGQRQRLAIARAILTDPRIMVLDDATAAIDSETEDLIRRGMRLVLQGRTTFVIAHRISTVKQADVVLVVEHGRITQTGTHAELMRCDGHYREIAAVQLYGDDGGPE